MVDFQCKPHYSYEDFLEVMRLLRAPGGCPWDREQTHGSIRRNFLEETYEVLDALDRDDPRDMCEELGDVMMQVAFHAQIEAERGNFTMDDVVDGVTKKLVYRHPHVFGTVEAETSEQVLVNWEALKRKEKGQATTADAVDCARRALRDGGRFLLCQRPEQLAEILAALRAARLEPKRLAFVKNRPDAAPWLFLVEAQKGRKTGLRVEPDILIQSGAALYGPTTL